RTARRPAAQRSGGHASARARARRALRGARPARHRGGAPRRVVRERRSAPARACRRAARAPRHRGGRRRGRARLARTRRRGRPARVPDARDGAARGARTAPGARRTRGARGAARRRAPRGPAPPRPRMARVRPRRARPRRLRRGARAPRRRARGAPRRARRRARPARRPRPRPRAAHRPTDSAMTLLALTAAFLALPQDQDPPPPAIQLGAGTHRYAWVTGWGRRPDGGDLGNTHGCIVVDRAGRIYCNTDTEDAVLVFDADGALLSRWGKDWKGGLHGMALVREGDDEFLYLAHTARGEVAKTTLSGEVLWTLGAPAEAGIYGEGKPYRPTGVAVADDGTVYVADGY